MHQEAYFIVNSGGGGEGHITMTCADFSPKVTYLLNWSETEANLTFTLENFKSEKNPEILRQN